MFFARRCGVCFVSPTRLPVWPAPDFGTFDVRGHDPVLGRYELWEKRLRALAERDFFVGEAKRLELDCHALSGAVPERVVRMASCASSRLGHEFHVIRRVGGEETSSADLGPGRPDVSISTELGEKLLLRNAALDERIEALDEEDSTYGTVRVCRR